MEYEDKSLTCADCGNGFTFSAEDQQFFHSKGYVNEPKRCTPCRDTRKAERTGSNSRGFGQRRQMFPVVCSDCGKETEVPFEPHGDKPVYCGDCYRKVRAIR
ncbi:MAG: zinc-ribbon domain containing protein [Dehalococcoidia bacterium]|nr:zinc-ribbon domain containing protein [Dehalococcoidia bacterium]